MVKRIKTKVISVIVSVQAINSVNFYKPWVVRQPSGGGGVSNGHTEAIADLADEAYPTIFGGDS